MSSQLDQILEASLPQTSFSANSRYANVMVTTYIPEGNSPIRFLRRRVVPQPERFAVLTEYSVRQNDRLDNITNQFLGDPEQFWVICDANGAMQPNELTDEVGEKIRITLPQGVPNNDA